MTTATPTATPSAAQRHEAATQRLNALAAEQAGLQTQYEAAIRSGKPALLMAVETRRLDLPGEVLAARIAAARAALDMTEEEQQSAVKEEQDAGRQIEESHAAQIAAEVAIVAARNLWGRAQGNLRAVQQHRERITERRRQQATYLDRLLTEQKQQRQQQKG